MKIITTLSLLLLLTSCASRHCGHFDFTDCITKLNHVYGMIYINSVEVCKLEQENRCQLN